MRIVIGRYLIRDYDMADVDALAKYANNPRVSSQLRDRFPYPYTDEAAIDWIGLATSQDPQTDFAIADAKELIGGIGIMLGRDVERRSAEIGYWLAEPFWGRGIATQAVTALSEWAFAQFDLCRLYAGVFEPNVASARVLEKAGYELEARLRKAITKNGRTMDQLLYARVK